MRLKGAYSLLLFLTVAIPSLIFCQTPGESRPSFEVASVKPNASGQNMISIGIQPGGRFVATGVPLKMLITQAYRIRDFQIIGGPGWISSDRWNIEAKAEEGSIPPRTGPADPTTPDPIALRLQSLLEDRFQLKTHRETRDLPAYELSISKSGSKVKFSEDQGPFKPPDPGETPKPLQMIKPGGPPPRGSVMMRMGNLEANGIEFSNFVQMLSSQLGRTVIDKTGIKGRVDVKLQWAPEMSQPTAASRFVPPEAMPAGAVPPAASDPSGPSIFTAVQEQLGLKLESTKGPVEVFIIDSVEKPSEN
jgi:uncharacterized protein (TIGR03435 family)